jgi:hypothetical protein
MRTLLQTTSGQDEPNLVFCGNRIEHHNNTHNRTTSPKIRKTINFWSKQTRWSKQDIHNVIRLRMPEREMNICLNSTSRITYIIQFPLFYIDYARLYLGKFTCHGLTLIAVRPDSVQVNLFFMK